MSDDHDKDIARIKDLAAMASVHFAEYLLIVRLEDGGLATKVSDEIWALGAMKRYEANIMDAALLDQVEKRSGEDGA